MRSYHFIVAAIVVWSLTNGIGRKASAADKEILIDAISVLIGSQASKEPDAPPLLISDIEFEATLILVGRFGPQGVQRMVPRGLWLEARRRATLIRLLASQARLLREEVTIVQKRYILQEIAEQMGGKKSLDQFLERSGLGREALDIWIENAALALNQIGYMKEQVELPSDSDEASGMADTAGGDELDPKAVREKYREMIMDEKTDEPLKKWLTDTSRAGAIRVIR